jgi:hypothetical protein
LLHHIFLFNFLLHRRFLRRFFNWLRLRDRLYDLRFFNWLRLRDGLYDLRLLFQLELEFRRPGPLLPLISHHFKMSFK